MSTLNLPNNCTYDALSLGEVMLRFDPGEARIHTARSFSLWEGGGEYNVVRNLSRVFNLRTAVATSLVDNSIGRLIENLIQAGGVDTSLIHWVPDDGLGRKARNGLNFTERGFGIRGAMGVSDRGNTAISQLKPEDIDFEHIFGELGVRWFHTGGIYALLSDSSLDTLLAAVKTAKKHGAIVSYDQNFRPSLWKALKDTEKVQSKLREVARYIDIMFASRYDFENLLGIDFDADKIKADNEVEEYDRVCSQIHKLYPNISVITRTSRTVNSASSNDWGALGWSASDGVHHIPQRKNLEVLDRVGSGDAYASGFIFALLHQHSIPEAMKYGLALGALTMTTPGDASMSTHRDVLQAIKGESQGTAR